MNTSPELERLEVGLARIERGWIKGNYKSRNHKGDYSYCAVGSLSDDSFPFSSDTVRYRAVRLLTKAMPWSARIHHRNKLTAYNDYAATAKGDIIALFKRAIKVEQDRLAKENANTLSLPLIETLDLRSKAIPTVVASDQDAFMAEVEELNREIKRELIGV